MRLVATDLRVDRRGGGKSGRRGGKSVVRDTVRIGILGPLEIANDDGSPVELTAGQQRALLAVLVLNRNEVVSVDRLIDALWGEQPPGTAVKALQGYVSQLRKAIGEERLVTRAPGYMLRVEADELDAARFEQLAPEDPAAALTLWRGPALAEFAYAEFARAEIERLEELRLACLEARIDRDLESGKHRELVGELHRLADEHPLREHFRAQQMLALYRAGRQADALEAYRSARATLVEELGIEPGEELRTLEQAILRQDPAIAVPSSGALGIPRHRRRLALVVVLALAIGGAVAGVLLSRDSGRAAPTVVPNSIARIDPRTNAVDDVIRVGRFPDQILAVGDAVFVANGPDGTVSRVDTATHQSRTVGGLEEPIGLASEGGRFIWVGSFHGGDVSRFDAETLELFDRIRLGGPSTGWLVTGAGSLWVSQRPDDVTQPGRVVRLALASGEKQREFRTGLVPNEITFGHGSAWVSNYGSGTVSRIDAGTGHVSSFRASGPADVVFAYGALWVLKDTPPAVWRVDPATLETKAIIPVGRRPFEIAAGAGSIWATNRDDGTVTRIDAKTNRAVATIRIGYRPASITVAPGGVWVGVTVGEL